MPLYQRVAMGARLAAGLTLLAATACGLAVSPAARAGAPHHEHHDAQPDPLAESLAAAGLPNVPLGQGDPVRGEARFRSSPCPGCHTVAGSGGAIGPDLTAIGARAAARAQEAGLGQPELYLVQSIVDPRAYVVDGFAPVMPNWQDMSLDEVALADLVAYLLTLRDAGPPEDLPGS